MTPEDAASDVLAAPAPAGEEGADRETGRLPEVLASPGRGLKLLGMLAVALAVYILRRPDSVVAPTFWAEDGTIFFSGALHQGLAAVFEPNNGQIWVFQRLIAGLLAPLPVIVQPALYSYVALVTAVLSCSIVLSARLRWQVPLGVRFACLLALLASPAVDETYGTLTNAHWWLAIGLVLLGLLRDPFSRRIKVGEIAFTALSAFSGFAALYGLPVLAARAWANRTRHSLVLAGVAAMGLVAQFAVLVMSARATNQSLLADPLTEFYVLIRRVFAIAALGPGNVGSLWPTITPPWWVLLIPAAVVAALVAVWIRGPRFETATLILVLLGGWLAELISLKYPIAVLWGYSIDGRYYVVPVAALYVSLLIAWPRISARRITAGLVCLILSAGILGGYRIRATTPAVDWAAFSRCMDRRTETCTTVIPPGFRLIVDPQGS